MENRVVAMVVVLWVVASAGRCWSSTEHAEEMKRSGEEILQEAAEKGESWADWAFDKFSEGLGLKQENARDAAQNLMDSVGDAASRTTDKMNSGAHEASRYASEKASEAASMAYGKAADIRDYTSGNVRLATDRINDAASSYAPEKAGEAAKMAYRKAADLSEYTSGNIRLATDRINYATETLTEAAKHGKGKAANAYDEAMEYGRNRAAEAYDIASEKTGDAKDAMAGAMDHGRESAAKAYTKATQMAFDRAQDSYNSLKKEIIEGSNMASEKAYEAMEGAMGHRREDDKKKIFEEAMNEVGESYNTAKETMTEKAKENYEAAKEKMSRTVGDVGAKMRKDFAEL